MKFARFIIDRAVAQARTDMAVVLAMVLAALTWPWALVLDLLGVAP